MSAVPGGVRRSRRSPLPRPADLLPGVRPAASRCSTARANRSRPDDPLGIFRRRHLLPARSGPSRGWAATTWPATPRSAAAVAELRRRKHRDEKPFALMVRTTRPRQALCEVCAGRARTAALAAPADRAAAQTARHARRRRSRSGQSLSGRHAALHAAPSSAAARGRTACHW